MSNFPDTLKILQQVQDERMGTSNFPDALKILQQVQEERTGGGNKFVPAALTSSAMPAGGYTAALGWLLAYSCSMCRSVRWV